MTRSKALVRFIAAMMVITFVLAGCSGENKGGASSAGGDQAKAKENTPIVFPPSEKLTLEVVAVPHESVKTGYNEMGFFQQLEEKSNVHIDWQMLTSDTAKERMNLIFATNDLPDVFFGPETTSHVTSDMTRQLIPLNDLIDKYAPNVKKILDENPSVRKLITKEDGNIYYLPAKDETPDATINNAMFINKKWLDELGLPVPTTTDEFFNTLKAFKEQDPNKNGKADEIPWTFRQTAIQGPDPVAAAFGKWLPGPGGKLYVENGEFVYAPVLEENKNFYVWMNKLYKAGLIDQEVFTQDANVFRAKIAGETPIIGVFNGWSETWAFGGENEDWIPLEPLKGPEGHQGWNTQEVSVVEQAFAITIENEHPELTMSWADQFYDPITSLEVTNGPFGMTMEKVGDDGQFRRLDPPEGVDAPSFMYGNAPGFYAPRWITAEMHEKEIIAEEKAEKRRLVAFYKPYTTKNGYLNPAFNDEDRERIDRWNQEVSDTNALYQQSFAKMVTGSNPEQDWEAFVKKAQDLGLEEILAIYNRYLE